MHRDPFADNVLVEPLTGDLVAFIDIEDVCVGPLLFDIACCAIGCCFTVENGEQVIDMTLLKALLKGYYTERSLSRLEQEHFVAFMRLTLLCNCHWRFVKFNSKSSRDDDTVPEEAKNSYIELLQRIEYLRKASVVNKINPMLEQIANVESTKTVNDGTTNPISNARQAEERMYS